MQISRWHGAIVLPLMYGERWIDAPQSFNEALAASASTIVTFVKGLGKALNRTLAVYPNQVKPLSNEVRQLWIAEPTFYASNSFILFSGRKGSGGWLEEFLATSLLAATLTLPYGMMAVACEGPVLADGSNEHSSS